MLSKTRRKLSGGVHENEAFLHVDLRNAISLGATYQNCTFRSCKLGSANFDGSLFLNCHFEECDFQHARFIARLVDTTFVRCNLDNSLFVTAILERTTFENCRLEYAVFSRATMSGGGMVDCALHGCYLDMAETDGVDFSGSNLWGAVAPLSCAVFVGNKFDHRQLHMLLALVRNAILPVEDLQKIDSILDLKTRKLVDRLISRQGSDEAQL